MKKTRIPLALTGMAALVALILWIGPLAVAKQLHELWWAAPILAALGLVEHVLRTWAWKQVLQAEGVACRFRALFKARLVSHSLAYFSGMGALVAEPLKPWLLRRAIGVEANVSAMMVDNSVYWIVSLFLITVGTFAAAGAAAETDIAFTLAAVSLVAFAGAALLLFTSTPLVSKGLKRLKINKRRSARWESLVEKAARIETGMRSFRLRYPRTMITLFGISLFVQLLKVAGVWIVLIALDVPAMILQVLAVEAVSRIVKGFSFSVPGRLGLDEAGGAGVFWLLSLPVAAGVTLALARRIQTVPWVMLGLLWLPGAGDISRTQETSLGPEEIMCRGGVPVE